MRKLMLSKLSPGSIDKVLCIHDWLILDEEGGEGPVEGAEADIVIVDTDAYYIEDFSRARKQLLIITNDEGSPHYRGARDELSEYYLREGKSEEEVANLLPGLSIHRRLNEAWASKSSVRTGREEERRVMKVEATYEMLGDGSWWDLVGKRGGSREAEMQARAPGN